MSFAYANEKGVGVPNVIHASGDSEEAEKEIRHRFNDSELFNYKPAISNSFPIMRKHQNSPARVAIPEQKL